MKKIIYEGRVEIHDDGAVYVMDTYGNWNPARLYELKHNKNIYLTSSVTLRGGQKSFYPRIEIARAFVPNPSNYEYVETIDGNQYNLSADNLRWMPKRDQVDKGKKTLQKNTLECEICGETVHKNRYSCAKCRQEDLKKQGTVRRRDRKLKSIRDKYQHVNATELGSEWLDILNKRLTGMSLSDIGELYGVSGARIGQRLKSIENGAPVTLK